MTKTILTAAILALAPLGAAAACWDRDIAMTCADGTTYDAETRSCVPVTG